MAEIDLLINDFCIGCGACTPHSSGEIYLDDYGKYQIRRDTIKKNEIKKVLAVCPFSSLVKNEDVLAEELFLNNKTSNSRNIGRYLDNYIGHITDESKRLNSSSGGIITWLLIKLLASNNITYAIHVGPSTSKLSIFEYVISDTQEAIIKGASSRYYPVEMSSILEYIKHHDGKYAIVALPCFTKSLRLLQQKDEIYKERIKYILSPICGHLKTANYADFLAKQKGIFPSDLKTINFRKKISGRRASQYGTEFVTGEDNNTKIVANSSFKMGTDWGHGMFKYPVCDYCDDIVGELADISVGDAWLPEYNDDFKGNSVITVRNIELKNIIEKGGAENELKLENVSADLIEKSQAGGIRNKKDDLKYRLWLKEQKGEWHPPKRVVASKIGINSKRRKIIRMRLRISELSHELYKKSLEKQDLNNFYIDMIPLLDHYFLINHGLISFLKKKIKQILWR